MDDNNVGYFGRSDKILEDFLDNLVKPESLVVNKDQVLKDFDDFERAICASPKMRQVFATLKQKFAEDPEYRAKVDANFVAGIMLLNLPSEQE